MEGDFVRSTESTFRRLETVRTTLAVIHTFRELVLTQNGHALRCHVDLGSFGPPKPPNPRSGGGVDAGGGVVGGVLSSG